MKQYRFLFILIFLTFIQTGLSAQNVNIFKRLRERSRVLEENEELRYRIDSLMIELETLRQDISEEERLNSEMLGVLEGNAAPDTLSYSMEMTDSLLSVWYLQQQLGTIDEGEGYNMDSVRFTSNVPDSVLMQRLEKMNSFITLPFNETVKNYMILYSEKMPTKMSKILGLCTYYMPIFEDVFIRYDLPQELKAMAIIESALDPVATSRSGAKGMWQFMYNTGKSYGLKINSFVDERLDVEKAVDAAARYLQDAYNIFGDWSLAISSYNCGAGNVNKAIKRAGGKRDFWSIYPYLPRETRGYVPAFVGALYAMNYSKEYGLVAEPCAMPAATDTFEIHRNLHFKQINEVLGVPMDMIQALNPQYTHSIIPGNEGSYILKLPYTYTNAFLENQDSLYAHNSEKLLDPQTIKNIQTSGAEQRVAYKVKSGDYLGRIASRYHVTVSQIRQWNNLRSNNIRVGQTLYIYSNGYRPSSNSSSASSSASTKSTTSTTAQSSGAYTIYTVKSGDTLYSIAKNYPGVSAQNIMDFNGISSKLSVGMKIKIPKNP